MIHFVLQDYGLIIYFFRFRLIFYHPSVGKTAMFCCGSGFRKLLVPVSALVPVPALIPVPVPDPDNV
jgi:hypothetical protein